MLIDLNLSPILYGYRVEKDKIFHKIVLKSCQIEPSTEGFIALAHLSPELKIPKWNCELYSNAHGTGSSKIKQQAINISISEALERWAFYDEASKGVATESSGYAAYPSLFGLKAKENSYFEALERWSLLKFNSGELPLSKSSEKALDIYYSSLTKGYFCLCHKETSNNLHAYGFGAGKSKRIARQSAIKELQRNKLLLEKSSELVSQNDNEQRLLYFAKSDGHAHFQEMIKIALELKKAAEPEVEKQYEVKGPWSKYTKVWRTIIKDYNPNFNNKRLFFF